MRRQVVVVEDDEKQAELMRRYLEHAGHAVIVVHDGITALDVIETTRADLVVLDAMLPGRDGFDVCRTLREVSSVRVLMVTARATEDDVLRGLGVGADDYMTKPFSPREMTARVGALLRRSPVATSVARTEPALRAGDVVVDPLAHEVHVNGELVRLTPGEFALLEHLAASPGRVFTRGQLLEVHHGSDRYITARTVDMHVMNLRRKIEADPREPRRLLTVYGVGYKLVADAN